MNMPADRLDEHAAQHDLRQIGILAAVKGAFLEHGLEGASMQDLARAAGMSAGNFYRYFPSKAVLIEALVEVELTRLQADFGTFLQTGDLMGTVRQALQARLEDRGCLMWEDIEVAATRSPEIAAIVRRFETAVLGCLTKVFAGLSGLSKPEAEREFSAHGLLLLVLFKDMVANCSPNRPLGRWQPSLQKQLQGLIFRQIEGIFDEVRCYKSERQAGISGVEAAGR